MAEQFAALGSCPRAGAVATARRSFESYRARAIARTNAAALMTWLKRFADPIVLADGHKLFTLQDAANHIAALPKAKRNAAHWKIATEALTLAAERDGAEFLARIAVQMAVNGGKPLAPEPPKSRLGKPPKPRVVH
jgi:hypothetical protein